MDKRQIGTRILAFSGTVILLIANALTKKAEEREMEDRIDEAVNRRLAERDSVVITINKES